MAIHKALSIRPEHIGEIAVGEKTNEYRTWSTTHRGDLVLCCTATRVSRGFAALLVELVDCARVDDLFEWRMANVRPVRPFLVSGRQRLFEIDADVECIEPTDDAVEAAYAEFEKEVSKL